MAADKVTTFKIFVGNLPDKTEEDEVRKVFEEFGNVVHCHCTTTGNRAFIYMEDDIEGKFAIGELKGRELNGKTLTIEEARKNQAPQIPTVKLLVKNISSEVDARGLRNMFKRFGYVVEVEINNGEGHVCLEAIADIRSAISEMNGYKIEDMELSVEPAPTPDEPEEPPAEETEPEPTSKSPKKNKNKGYGHWDSSWSRAKQEYYESERHRQDYDSYDYSGQEYEDPWNNPEPSPFNQQPERILRDPYSQRGPPRRMHRPPFGNAHHGGRMPRGPMGPRGPPPRMMQHPPPFLGPPMGGMPGRIMRSGHPHGGNSLRGSPFRGPRPQFRPEPYNKEPTFFRRDELMQQNNPFVQEEYGEEVFYEDEPLSAVARSKNQSRSFMSGANSTPLGGMGPVPRTSWSNFSQGNGNARGGPRRGGVGRGQGRPPPKFTAMTGEVTPGEKYPVPPMYNPGFRAPIKRSKDEGPIKRKGNKKKKPLVPAELPDYSVPVPELPRQSVPKGAVLKAFPPPQGHSLMDSDTFGGSGSGSNFFGYDDDSQQKSSQMDFTTDYM